MICLIASLVPNIRANKPKATTMIFLIMRYLQGPNPMSQNVITSMRAGAINPSSEKQNAPITPINGPIVGTATASNTHAVTMMVLIM